MNQDDVAVSLASPIAKIWPDEDNGFPSTERRLRVTHWEEFEREQSHNPLWRWTPCNRALEIKGALIDADLVGFEPKQGARAGQIHRSGFT